MGAHPHRLVIVDADDLCRLNATPAVVGRGQQPDLVAVLVLLVNGIILLCRDHPGFSGSLVHGSDIFKVPHDGRQLAYYHGQRRSDRRIRRIGHIDGSADGLAIIGGICTVRIEDAHCLIGLAPAEVRRGIVYIHIFILGTQSKLTGFRKAQTHFVRFEGKLVWMNQFNTGDTDHFPLVEKLHTQSADNGSGSGEKTGSCIYSAHRSRALAQSPCNVFRYSDRRTGAISTVGSKLNTGGWCVKVAVGGKNRMVEYPGRLRLGYHHQGSESRSLHTVGGRVPNFQLARACSLRNKCRCTAAIAIHRIHAAQIDHGLCQFITRHTNGVWSLTAIHHKHDHTAISLNANGRSRCTTAGGVIGRGIHIYPVLNEYLEGGSRLPLISAQRLAATANLSLSVICQDKAGLRLPLMVNDAIDDQITNRLIACPRQVGINGAHNVDAQHSFCRFCLLGSCLRLPVVGIHITVAGKQIHIRIAQIDFHNMADILIVAGGIIQVQCVLLDTGCNRILFSQDDRVITITTADPIVRTRPISFSRTLCGFFTCLLL